MSNQVLTRVKWVESQRSKTAMQDSLQESKDFIAIKKKQKPNMSKQMQSMPKENNKIPTTSYSSRLYL